MDEKEIKSRAAFHILMNAGVHLKSGDDAKNVIGKLILLVMKEFHPKVSPADYSVETVTYRIPKLKKNRVEKCVVRLSTENG